MPAIIVTGGQWGDEGKGKIVDLLAQKSHMIVRYSGGDNAGHTVINPYGEFKLHVIPSGIFSPRAVCVIGNGMAVNPDVLVSEIDYLVERGVDTSRLLISDRANVIMPYHLLLDGMEEERRGGRAIGTTRKGIGPVFSDKVARRGIRMGDLLERDALAERLQPMLRYKNAVLTGVYHAEPLPFDKVFEQCLKWGDRLRSCVCETSIMIAEALDRGETVLLEGAQGALLDPDFGTYPYTTSSSPLSGGACIGAGVGPTRINHVVGILKAYCTRVGGGPFPTEMKDDMGNWIREKAHEYGATTGRARRCGWFDAVAARFTSRINGFTDVALTRLDILDGVPSLKICTAYQMNGSIIDYFPSVISHLAKCQPVYEEVPGWQTSTEDIRCYDELPQAARNYIARLEQLVGCRFNFISVGAKREETIVRYPIC